MIPTRPFPRAPACLLATLLALAGPPAGADETLDRIRQRGKAVIGVIANGNGAFGSVDPVSGEAVGFNPELARRIAQDLGVKAELVLVQPANRVQFLQQGKVDLLVASMLWTAERAEQLDFVPTPYYRNGGTAIFRRASGIRAWEDLRGKPVCLSQGSSYAKPLGGRFGAEVKGFKSMSESLLALRGGTSCVAAVHESVTLNGLVAREAEWRDYAVLEDEVDPAPQVVWVRKGEKDAVAAIDRIIQAWHRTGWLRQVEEKVGLSPRSKFLEELQRRYAAAP